MQNRKQLVAAALSGLLFLTNTAFVYALESNFWSERKKMTKLELAQLPTPLLPTFTTTTPAPSNIKLSPLFEKQLALSQDGVFKQKIRSLVQSLPSRSGSIRAFHVPAHPTSKIVLHIQDVHLNPEAQFNIAETLKSVWNKLPSSFTAVEGASEEVHLMGLRHPAHRPYVRTAAKEALDAKSIAGSFYAALDTPHEPPMLLGIDDNILYDENVAAFRNTRPMVKKTQSLLNEVKRTLTRQANKIFNPELLDFQNQVDSFRQGLTPLGDYIAFLAEQSPSISPDVFLFVEAYELESTMDLDRVRADREQILNQLIQKLSAQESNALLDLSVSYRMEDISHVEFYRQFRELCQKNNVNLDQTPHLNTYIHYLLLSDAINMDRVYGDIKKMEEANYHKWTRTPEEADLIIRLRWHSLSEKLVEFSLSAEEWQDYKALKRMHPDFQAFEKFYEAAEKRDGAMANKLLQSLQQTNTQFATVVTGGFHSKGLVDRLNKEGVTVVSFVPRITHIESLDDTAYLSYFTQEKSPLEQLFQGEKLFMAPPPGPTSQRVAIGMSAAKKELDSTPPTGATRNMNAAAIIRDLLPELKALVSALMTPRGCMILLKAPRSGTIICLTPGGKFLKVATMSAFLASVSSVWAGPLDMARHWGGGEFSPTITALIVFSLVLLLAVNALLKRIRALRPAPIALETSRSPTRPPKSLNRFEMKSAPSQPEQSESSIPILNEQTLTIPTWDKSLDLVTQVNRTFDEIHDRIQQEALQLVDSDKIFKGLLQQIANELIKKGKVKRVTIGASIHYGNLRVELTFGSFDSSTKLNQEDTTRFFKDIQDMNGAIFPSEQGSSFKLTFLFRPQDKAPALVDLIQEDGAALTERLRNLNQLLPHNYSREIKFIHNVLYTAPEKLSDAMLFSCLWLWDLEERDIFQLAAKELEKRMRSQTIIYPVPQLIALYESTYSLWPTNFKRWLLWQLTQSPEETAKRFMANLVPGAAVSFESIHRHGVQAMGQDYLLSVSKDIDGWVLSLTRKKSLLAFLFSNPFTRKKQSPVAGRLAFTLQRPANLSDLAEMDSGPAQIKLGSWIHSFNLSIDFSDLPEKKSLALKVLKGFHNIAPIGTSLTLTHQNSDTFIRDLINELDRVTSFDITKVEIDFSPGQTRVVLQKSLNKDDNSSELEPPTTHGPGVFLIKVIFIPLTFCLQILNAGEDLVERTYIYLTGGKVDTEKSALWGDEIRTVPKPHQRNGKLRSPWLNFGQTLIGPTFWMTLSGFFFLSIYLPTIFPTWMELENGLAGISMLGRWLIYATGISSTVMFAVHVLSFLLFVPFAPAIRYKSDLWVAYRYLKDGRFPEGSVVTHAPTFELIRIIGILINRGWARFWSLPRSTARFNRKKREWKRTVATAQALNASANLPPKRRAKFNRDILRMEVTADLIAVPITHGGAVSLVQALTRWIAQLESSGSVGAEETMQQAAPTRLRRLLKFFGFSGGGRGAMARVSTTDNSTDTEPPTEISARTISSGETFFPQNRSTLRNTSQPSAEGAEAPREIASAQTTIDNTRTMTQRIGEIVKSVVKFFPTLRFKIGNQYQAAGRQWMDKFSAGQSLYSVLSQAVSSAVVLVVASSFLNPLPQQFILNSSLGFVLSISSSALLLVALLAYATARAVPFIPNSFNPFLPANQIFGFGGNPIPASLNWGSLVSIFSRAFKNLTALPTNEEIQKQEIDQIRSMIKAPDVRTALQAALYNSTEIAGLQPQDASNPSTEATSKTNLAVGEESEGSILFNIDGNLFNPEIIIVVAQQSPLDRLNGIVRNDGRLAFTEDEFVLLLKIRQNLNAAHTREAQKITAPDLRKERIPKSHVPAVNSPELTEIRETARLIKEELLTRSEMRNPTASLEILQQRILGQLLNDPVFFDQVLQKMKKKAEGKKRGDTNHQSSLPSTVLNPTDRPIKPSLQNSEPNTRSEGWEGNNLPSIIESASNATGLSPLSLLKSLMDRRFKTDAPDLKLGSLLFSGQEISFQGNPRPTIQIQMTALKEAASILYGKWAATALLSQRANIWLELKFGQRLIPSTQQMTVPGITLAIIAAAFELAGLSGVSKSLFVVSLALLLAMTIDEQGAKLVSKLRQHQPYSTIKRHSSHDPKHGPSIRRGKMDKLSGLLVTTVHGTRPTELSGWALNDLLPDPGLLGLKEKKTLQMLVGQTKSEHRQHVSLLKRKMGRLKEPRSISVEDVRVYLQALIRSSSDDQELRTIIGDKDLALAVTGSDTKQIEKELAEKVAPLIPTLSGQATLHLFVHEADAPAWKTQLEGKAYDSRVRVIPVQGSPLRAEKANNALWLDLNTFETGLSELQKQHVHLTNLMILVPEGVAVDTSQLNRLSLMNQVGFVFLNEFLRGVGASKVDLEHLEEIAKILGTHA